MQHSHGVFFNWQGVLRSIPLITEFYGWYCAVRFRIDQHDVCIIAF